MFAQVGPAGELRAGPLLAARFGCWSLVRPDETLGDDRATVEVQQLQVVDTFRYQHDRLDLWLDCGRAWWCWRAVQQIDEAAWATPGGRPMIRIK